MTAEHRFSRCGWIFRAKIAYFWLFLAIFDCFLTVFDCACKSSEIILRVIWSLIFSLDMNIWDVYEYCKAIFTWIFAFWHEKITIVRFFCLNWTAHFFRFQFFSVSVPESQKEVPQRQMLFLCLKRSKNSY